MIKLSEISTRAPEELSKSKVKSETAAMAKKIGELAQLMYAQGKHSILLVFQGMDASGKDGVTRKVFKYCSPSGIRAHAFKKPTDEEFGHDFLWRVHKLAPEKGMIEIYNRSHYEDVLIQRVHKWIDEDKVNMRFDAIDAYENLLQEDNGTIVMKFYMHISKERQKEKLLERIDVPEKNWKHNDGDWEQRKHWDEYMKCYEDAINRTKIPWIVAPVDQRWYRDYFIAKTVLARMQELDLTLPVLESRPEGLE